MENLNISDLVDLWIKEKGWKLTRISHPNCDHWWPEHDCDHWRHKTVSIFDRWTSGWAVSVGFGNYKSIDPTDPNFFKELEAAIEADS